MIIKRRITIREVAQAARVSTQTVSRVLNHRPDVSSTTRERVQQAIDQLGYSPNVLARSLIKGRSHTIGMVSYGLGYYGPARILTGVERRANEMGYSLQLNLLRRPESNNGEDVFQSLLDRRVDGIIWAVPEIGANRDWLVQGFARSAQNQGVPVVALNMRPVAGVPMAAIDNFDGGQTAANHLLAQGFRRIGIITGPDTWWESQQREAGWRAAMTAAGVEDLEALKVSGDWYPSSGERGLRQLLAQAPNLEAVFACNDPMALGALQAARILGKRVPGDLAVVGYDDVPEAAYYFPALTTVHQPLVELGGRAVELLHHLLEEQAELAEEPDEERPSPEAWISPQLIVRDSAQRLPIEDVRAR